MCKYLFFVFVVVVSNFVCGEVHVSKSLIERNHESKESSIATKNTKPISTEDAKISSSEYKHMIFSFILANYFCQNKKWPKNIEELKKYNIENEIVLEEKTNWDWFLREGVTYEVNRFGTVKVKTPKGKSFDEIAIASSNVEPECGENNIQPKVHIDYLK